MTAAHRIVVSSRAMGSRDYVTVWMYDTVEELRIAAARFHGRTDRGDTDTLGVSQSINLASNHRTHRVIIRLAREHLGSRIVSHEMHHATTALYGAHVADRISTLHHLHHHNEPFAHLYSDLYGRLIQRLYDLGYYS